MNKSLCCAKKYEWSKTSLWIHLFTISHFKQTFTQRRDTDLHVGKVNDRLPSLCSCSHLPDLIVPVMHITALSTVWTGCRLEYTGVVCPPLPKKTPQRGDCGQSQFPHTTRLGLVSILKVKNK